MSAFSQRAVLISIVLAYVAVFISAECPNACSSHGRCGAFDACECYRNWMSNDCSERKLFSSVTCILYFFHYYLNNNKLNQIIFLNIDLI